MKQTNLFDLIKYQVKSNHLSFTHMDLSIYLDKVIDGEPIDKYNRYYHNKHKLAYISSDWGDIWVQIQFKYKPKICRVRIRNR